MFISVTKVVTLNPYFYVDKMGGYQSGYFLVLWCISLYFWVSKNSSERHLRYWCFFFYSSIWVELGIRENPPLTIEATLYPMFKRKGVA